MRWAPLGIGRRVVWMTLALLHRVGMFAVFNTLANRFTKVDSFPYVQRRACRNVQILTYHRVTRSPDSFLPSMPLRVFERHMECLKRQFHVLDLSEAVNAMARQSVPCNAVVVTFDDGYRDNYEYAYPVLNALSMNATIFLTTGVVGTDQVLWHDRVFRMFGTTSARVLRGFGPGGADLPLGTPLQTEASRDRVLLYLKSCEPESRDKTIDELAKKLDVKEPSPGRRLMLDWEEVRDMHRHGIAFGGHTVTHSVLSRIPIERAEWEVAESKTAIERELKARVTAFAYPNGQPGDFNAVTKRLLRRTGYTCAVTSVFGSNSLGDRRSDPLELRRDSPHSCSSTMFAARLNAYRFLS